MSFCITCGKQNSDTAKFCTGCGSALKNTDTPQAQATKNAVIHKNKKRWVWPVVTISALLILSASAWFLFFRQKKDLPVMMVLPDKLKLRSTKSDTDDANMILSADYGTEVQLLKTEDNWAQVKLNGNIGFMKTKYLTLPIDFYKVESLIKPNNDFLAEYASQPEHPVPVEEALTETRYKLSLLRYFKKKGYTIPLSKEIKKKYSITDTASNKGNWKIRADYGGAGPLNVALKGNFTGSGKRGLVVMLENADTNESKFVFFNYDDSENELDVSEFTGKNYAMYMIEKPDNLVTLNSKELGISPSQDVLTVTIAITGGEEVFYFLNGKMVERTVY